MVLTDRISALFSPTFIYMDFYDRVKLLAKRKRYSSLQEFILSIGLNQDSYYSMKKTGNLPRADDAFKIAQALGTTVEYLVIGCEQKSLNADETFDEIQVLIDRYRRNPGRKKT